MSGARLRVQALPDRARHALAEFFRLEAAGGILLILAAVLALVFANTTLRPLYVALQSLPVTVAVGELKIAKPALLWINDGLMAIFFLLVSLEIKREALTGQLSSRAQLLLPLVLACAGVAAPALIFFGFNHAHPAHIAGWAVPTATDIAFALGILSLLGSRAPSGLKLLLSTIAVVDDLIAIVIIALFYTERLSLLALGWALAAIAAMVWLNRRGVTRLAPYLLLGVVVWVSVLKSGVHATLAGVATGLLIPHRSGAEADGHADAQAHSPLESLEHALHPWVAYAILPLFAFVNAGLYLGALHWNDLLAPVTLGVALGLLLGKPLGIAGVAWLGHRLGWLHLPEGVRPRDLPGLGLLCGIGFTMSVFIASLAYGSAEVIMSEALLGILAASAIAALLGLGWLAKSLPKTP
jgi:NhaA family Na+:H+ antiporter